MSLHALKPKLILCLTFCLILMAQDIYGQLKFRRVAKSYVFSTSDPSTSASCTNVNWQSANSKCVSKYEMRSASDPNYAVIGSMQAKVVSQAIASNITWGSTGTSPLFTHVGSSGNSELEIKFYQTDGITPKKIKVDLLIKTLSVLRDETITINKAEVESYTRAKSTNINTIDHGDGTMSFYGTQNTSTEGDALMLSFSEASSIKLKFASRYTASSGNAALAMDLYSGVTHFTAPCNRQICTTGNSCVTSAGNSGTYNNYCDCIPNSGGGTSGGTGGGLESNNRLSNKVAQRNYARIINPSEDLLLKEAGLMPFTTLENSYANEINLSQTLPTSLWGAQIGNSAPTDLIPITNATEVQAIDYYINNTREAVALAIKSENGVYEHSKYICDRLDGGTLLNISTVQMNGGQFLMYEILNGQNQIEHAISFGGYISDELFHIENHWNLEKYTQANTYYNYQLWSSDPQKTKELLAQTLVQIEAQKEIGKINSSGIPNLYVMSGFYQNGTLQLKIKNNSGANAMQLEGEIRTTEMGAADYFSENIQLTGEITQTLNIETGNLYDLGFSIKTGGSDFDRLFVADGSWGQDDLNDGSFVNSFEIFPEEEASTPDVFQIERAFRINADVLDYQNVFRSISPKWDAVNLQDFNLFEFDANGNGNVVITLVRKSVDEWNKQLSFEIELGESMKRHSLPISEFENYTSNENLSDVVMIVFSLLGDTKKFQNKSMHVAKAQFGKATSLQIEAEEFVFESRIFPIPSSDVINISWFTTTVGMVTCQIRSANGTLINSHQFENRLGALEQLSIQDLPKGMYFLEFVVKGETVKTEKLIKK